MCIYDADPPLLKKKNNLVRMRCVCRSRTNGKSPWSTVKRAERRHGLSMRCLDCHRHKSRYPINTPFYICRIITPCTHPITPYHTLSLHGYKALIPLLPLPTLLYYIVSTQQVYHDVSGLVVSVLDGYNVCIFAYGQTGSPLFLCP